MKKSLQTQARMAGFLYFLVIIGGLFAELVVRANLFVHNDVNATCRNILSHEQLYRYGFAVEIFYCVCNIPLVLIFWNLFNKVNRNLTMLVVMFSLVGTAIEGLCMLAHYAPLIFLKSAQHLTGFSLSQLETLSYASLELFGFGFMIALVFFGGYCISIGILILRSGVLPRIIGALLAFQGVCYLINSFSHFIAPGFGVRFFPVLMLSGLGEVSFCLWLLIKGVNKLPENEK